LAEATARVHIDLQERPGDCDNTKGRQMSRSRRYQGVAFLLALILCLIGGGYALYRYWHPYGRSHCCDKCLYFALLEYAEMHGGDFPDGEATPEASLSLVNATSESGYADLLCGKSGSASAAQELLDSGRLLVPDTCGWNYVEGLRLDDDRDLALFWDKEGLNHWGGRLSGGGHVVTFVGGSSRHVPASEWDQFLDEQKRLFSQRKKARQAKGGA